MAVGDAHVFPGFLTPVLTQLFFPKPLTTFLTCFCRGARRKYARKKVRVNERSNSQPPGRESDTLTTEAPRRGKIQMQVLKGISNLNLTINSIQNDKMLAKSKFKAFVDDNLIMDQASATGYQHFLLFPHCIPKLSFSGSFKKNIGWYIVSGGWKLLQQ